MARMLRLPSAPVSKAKSHNNPVKDTICRLNPLNRKLTGKPKTKDQINLVPLPYEYQVQVAYLEWADVQKYKGNPLSLYIHHSANGGKRDAREGKYFKEMGVKAGYPDLTIDIAKGGYHGMRIELKRGSNDKESDKQKERIALLIEEGYHAVFCKGIDAAIKATQDYMKL
jgi:hypothetical protein